MKKLFKTLTICALIAWVGGFATSCVSDEVLGPSEFAITGEPVVNNAISVDVPVKAVNLAKLAYMVEEYIITENGEAWTVKNYDANKQPVLNHKVEKNPSIALIFRAQRNGKGKTIESVKKETSIHITGNEGLDKNKKFVVYFAAAVSDSEYYNNGQIYSVTFETPEKYSDDDVTVIRESFEGMDVFVQVPPSVKKANRVVRWGVTNIATIAYNEKKPIAEMLYMCDYVYPASIIRRDTTLNINHHNAYRRNDKGEIGYYIIGANNVTEVAPDGPEVAGGTAEAIQYYYNFQPGEPLVLMLGEADYCSPQTGLEPTCKFSFGNDVGWYWFPYDMDAYIEEYYKNPNVDPELFWHEGAWWRRVDLTLPGPDKFDGNVGVNISNLSSNSGKITFTPDNRTFMYLVGVYEERDAYQSGFNDITEKFLDGKEELWQWFTTAEMAPQFGIGFYYGSEGVQEFILEDYFVQLTAGGKYHIVVNAVGGYVGDDGEMYPDMTAQNFQHIEFELKDYSLPEPELVVTPVEAYSPWKVKFNVKNPDYANNKVSKVAFVANFTREFDSFMKANNYTYTDMVMMNASSPYYQLSDSDIAMVNSAAGAEIEFDVFENSAFTIAVMGWNEEGRASNPDKEGAQAHAEAFSLPIQPAEPLDMTKLNSLKGDWTATATVNVYDSTTGTHTATQRSWKVTIGDLNAENTLTEADYATLEAHGVGRDAANVYLAEYNRQAAKYNNDVLGQNRVLCLGWAVDDDRTMSTTSPWDLFMMEDYNASVVDYLFYDFGPKWFLQVNENGQAFVPVHYNRIPTLTSWYNGMNHYLCGGNYETGIAYVYHPVPEYMDNVETAGLPVDISEDGNTVTINGYTVKFATEDGGELEVNCYPNVVYDYYGNLQFYNSHVTSSVVLTRGWTENSVDTPTPAKISSVATVNGKAAKLANGATYTTPKRPYAKSVFTPQPKKAPVKRMSDKHPSVKITNQSAEAPLSASKNLWRR